MARLSQFKNLLSSKNTESTTWIQRSVDRRKINMGRTFDRRKSQDRRLLQQGSKSYEYVGLSLGGWTEIEE